MVRVAVAVACVVLVAVVVLVACVAVWILVAVLGGEDVAAEVVVVRLRRSRGGLGCARWVVVVARAVACAARRGGCGGG